MHAGHSEVEFIKDTRTVRSHKAALHGRDRAERIVYIGVHCKLPLYAAAKFVYV